MYAIETTALAKAYGRTRALDCLNLHVPKGSIYGFVGRNGAGKSTAMRIIAGLARPTEGTVFLMGEPAARYTLPIGALIEQPGVVPNLSAEANVHAKALALGMPDPAAHTAELLERVGLADHARKAARQLSLGQKQRLGLALALAGNPDILLLDEPLNGLDPEAARSMRELLAGLARERAVTIVISSHVLDQLHRLATHFGVIEAGRMRAEFTAEELEASTGEAVVVRTNDQARTVAALGQAAPPEDLRALPDGRVQVLHRSTDADVAAVSALLAAASLEVYELAVQHRDIEDYFLSLMGGDE